MRRATVSIAAWLGALSAVLVAALASSPARADDGDGWTHGYAAFGAPKYPPGFTHFEYVDPNAPKGGTLYLRNPDRRTSFDKFNPFTTRGNAPAGLSIFMFEPLAVMSGDEPQTMYGLLAQSMRVAPDRSSVTFRLHPQARFTNGDPVTAADVQHSFAMQSGPYAAPGLRAVLAVVERATVLDERTIRFDLKERTADAVFTVGTLRVFSRKWGAQPDGTPRRFDEIVSEYPITSGPYTIARADGGRRIEFVRDANYWARDLPVRRGFFNFDRVVYRYYRDAAIAREAFKAGEFDILREYSSRAWVRQHVGPKWDDGRIVKDPFETQVGQGMQSYQLNLRRPKFQDLRVRRALDLTYDFDTLNRLKAFKRVESVFSNSDFAAQGEPSAAERALLEPFRAELPPEVFGPAYRAPTTGGEPARLRANLLRARALLQEAGWTLAPDGKLRNAAGEAFVIEYLSPSEGARMPDWELNLSKLGIELKVRSVDFALYRRRLETFDFDMITIVESDFQLPNASDLVNSYGSKAADEPGSSNFRGVKSRAADAVLQAMGRATTLDELRTAARAFDRIVMWSAWQVPDLYAADEKASYWNRFGKPRVRPKYFTIESALSDNPAWAVTTWWADDSLPGSRRK
ncbi:extracellular solute-binding protein [Azohydromonas sediminis]|uniref:extracellular solute-binding protein n=1 Tax=Azohydromonas sediminis TaxID=2259674 RepID=UPI000E64DF1F|nr:extracellular solute-binding protein [Azohydromonas sediminis]